MNFYHILFNLSTHLSITVAFVAIAGDFLTSNNNVPVLKALCDNITHALIGGLSWCICYLNREKNVYDSRKGVLEIVACTVLSSAIDLDHFIAAKSLLLKAATSLKHRPPLHCSTVPLVVFTVLLLSSYILECGTLKRLALIVLTAFSTHHIRDATRRGLWFYPYGSTPPIPYLLYIFLTCLVPYLIIFLDRWFTVGRRLDVGYYSHVI